MTPEELRTIVRASAGEPDRRPLDDASMDAAFHELGYDSVQVMEIAAHIELRLGVALPDHLVAGSGNMRELLLAVNAVAPDTV